MRREINHQSLAKLGSNHTTTTKVTGSTVKFGGTFLRESKSRDAMLYSYATHEDMESALGGVGWGEDLMEDEGTI